MKYLIKFVLFALFVLGLVLFLDYYLDKVDLKYSNIVLETGEYAIKDDFGYFKKTTDFSLKDKKQLLNIIYTALNNGKDKVVLTCNRYYDDCISDTNEVLDDADLLSKINDFIHPYYSFSDIVAEISHKQITLKFAYNYTMEERKELDSKVLSILKETTDEKDSIKDKIVKIHNYIIDNSDYPKNYNSEINHKSYYSKATGNLMMGYGICSGYSDSMSLFLYKLGVKNYQVSSDNHVWNVVFFDDKAYHIDVTWDDMGLYDDKAINTSYLLIENSAFKKMEIENHEFDSNIYLELA